MTPCANCPRTAPDGQHLCQLHTAELRAWLSELPHQARLLSAFLTPGARPAQGRIGGTGRATAPVPVDLRVLNLLIGPGRYDPLGPDDDGEPPITAVLGAWAGHIAYHYPSLGWHPHRKPDDTLYVLPCEQAEPRHGPTTTGWCTWHLAYLPYTLTQPTIGDFHRQLGDLMARIRDLTHSEPRRHPKDAPCPSCQAYRLAAVDGQWGITCTACGHHLEPDAYDQHATRFLQHLQAQTATEDGPADAPSAYVLDKDPRTVSH